MTILDNILAKKKHEIAELLLQALPEPVNLKPRQSLLESLVNATRLQVIAEIKRASPSKGVIAENIQPGVLAKRYESGGAACISVLTDTTFFKGSFADLEDVARTVTIPILCKDFIIHPVQIDHAAHAGASVILLIVAALSYKELEKLYAHATNKGLEALVEVHNKEELDIALQVGAKLIGVNNRDLRTFEVKIAHTAEIAAHFPFNENRVLISESGIWDGEDAKQVSEYGASGVLVGESLMRSDDIENAIRSLQVKRGVFIK